jgi:microcompartment protein CcmL/EutN
MSELPAIALIELKSIALGARVADAMAKEAPLALLQTGTVHPGKFLVLIGGGTGEVEQSFAAGRRLGASEIVDEVLLPDVHPDVVTAIEGKQRSDAYDSLVVLETSTVSAILRATDAAVKGALVQLKEMRLADDLGGKGIAVLTGELTDVEAAADVAARAVDVGHVCLRTEIVSRVDERIVEELRRSTRFQQAGGA